MYLLAGVVFVFFNTLLVISRKFTANIFFVFYMVFFSAIIFWIAHNIQYLSRDYYNYTSWFDEIFVSSFFENSSGKDPGFKLLVSFIQYVFGNNYIYIYYIYMILILYFKYKFSSQIFFRSNLITCLWLLFSATFILFEVTQIRAGLAISLASYLIVSNLNSKPNIWFFLALSICFFLHKSIVILILAYLIIVFFKKLILKKISIIMILLFGLIVNLFFQDQLNNTIGIYLVDNDRTANYLNGVDDVTAASLFSFFFIVKIFCLILLLYFWDLLSEQKKYFVFFSALSCFFYMVFMFNNVFAFRISEIFILFALACFIFPLDFKFKVKELKYLYFFGVLVLGAVFYNSSCKILLGN